MLCILKSPLSHSLNLIQYCKFLCIFIYFYAPITPKLRQTV
nr:MAG TPA: hypothetical protein [Caudoviricetes sp.]